LLAAEKRFDAADGYLEGDIRPPSTFIVVGRGLDAAVNADLTSKMRTGQLLGTGEMQDIASGIVERDFLEPVDLTGERISKGTARELALNRARTFSKWTHLNLTPTIQPKAVQRPWSVRLDKILERRGLKGLKIDYVGTMDIEEWLYDFSSIDTPKGTCIRDIKTSRRSAPKNAVTAKHTIQLSSYAFGKRVLDGVMPERVQVDYLVDLKSGVSHQPITGIVNDTDFAMLFNRLENLAHHLKAGVFAPAPRDSWMCSEKWCGYWHSCSFVQNNRTIHLGVPKPKLYKINAAPLEPLGRTHDDNRSSASKGAAAKAADASPGRGLFIVPRTNQELDPTDD